MKEKELNFIGLIEYLWNRKKFIITSVFIITSISIVICLFLPKYYKATAQLMPSSSDDSALSLLSGGLSGMSFGRMFGNNTDQFKILAILKSRTFKTEIVKRFNLVKNYKVDNIEEAIKELDDNIDAGIGDEMQIYISIWDRNQDEVANITNYAISCLDSLNIALATKQAKEMKQFMGERVIEVIDTLKLLQNELINYLGSEQVISLENQVFVGLESAGQIKSQILATEIELSIAENTLKSNNPKINMMKSKLDILNTRFADYMTGKDKSGMFPNFKKVPEIGVNLTELERKVEYYSLIIKYLGPQFEKAKIDEKKDIPTIEVLDYGVRPERKDKPKRALIVVLVCFLSTIMSSAYVLVKDEK